MIRFKLHSFWLIPSFVTLLTASSIAPQVQANEPDVFAEIPSVSQLADVQPTDWAFEALRSLVERYGCIAGRSDQGRSFAGNKPLSRYEFATGLNQCLNKINESLKNQISRISAQDLNLIQRLQEEFATELTTLRGRIDALEVRSTTIQAQQFSATTKLSTSLVVVASDLTGDNADANPDTSIQSNFSLSYRMRLNLTTSFTGRDRLLVRLQSSNRVPNFSGLSGTEMTRLSYEVGNTDNRLTLNLLEYRFPVSDQLTIHLYGNSASHHYYANYLNPYFASFGGSEGSPSQFSERNPIYRIGDIIGAGVGAVYRFSPKARLDLGYLARDADLTTAGLFGSTYSALAQLSVKPATNVEFGLTYIRNYSPSGNLLHRTGSTFANIPFGMGVPLTSDSFGLAALWNLTPRFAISGWFGYTQVDRTDGRSQQAEIVNYAVNFAFPDLFTKGAIGGIGFGMPPKVIRNASSDRVDPGTGFHVEVFYQYPLTNQITLIPGIIYLTNPNHNSRNGDIFIGTFRTIFNF